MSEIDEAKAATILLLTVFTAEQLKQLADAAVYTRDQAVIRRCTESFSVEFNDKGYPRYGHYRHSFEFVKPTTYKAE